MNRQAHTVEMKQGLNICLADRRQPTTAGIGRQRMCIDKMDSITFVSSRRRRRRWEMRDTSIRKDNLDQWWKLSKAERERGHYFRPIVLCLDSIEKKTLARKRERKPEVFWSSSTLGHFLFLLLFIRTNSIDCRLLYLSDWNRSRERNRIKFCSEPLIEQLQSSHHLLP